MTTESKQQDEQWQDAQLGGMTCQAHAWTTTTAVADAPGQGVPHRSIRGVQTWRGRAIVSNPHFWSTWRQRNRMVYEGPVEIEGEMHHVSAEVFVYTARRVAPRSSHQEQQYDPDVVAVQFIGAGRLPPDS